MNVNKLQAIATETFKDASAKTTKAITIGKEELLKKTKGKSLSQLEAEAQDFFQKSGATSQEDFFKKLSSSLQKDSSKFIENLGQMFKK